MRIYTDGAEIIDGKDIESFWNNIEKTKGKAPIPSSILFNNQDKVTITIEKGYVHIEGDTCHFLFFNHLIEKEFIIEFLVQCEYCRCFTPASRFCDYCGALML